MKCFIYWTAELKSLFQASIRNCLNCVYNCDDHSSLDKKTKLNICHHMLTSSTQLQNRSFHVVERTRTSTKCQKMKNTRAKRAKNTVFHCQICKFAGFFLSSSSWLLKLSIIHWTTLEFVVFRLCSPFSWPPQACLVKETHSTPLRFLPLKAGMTSQALPNDN